MQEYRDLKTGRFLPGNKAAKGNRGNRYPKYRNKNAEKHGFYSRFKQAEILEDGYLYIILGRWSPSHSFSIRVSPEQYQLGEQGRIKVNDFIASILEKLDIEITDFK